LLGSAIFFTCLRGRYAVCTVNEEISLSLSYPGRDLSINVEVYREEMPLQWPLRWVLFVLRVISKGIGLWDQRGFGRREGGRCC
jgi:hypothetical protein